MRFVSNRCSQHALTNIWLLLMMPKLAKCGNPLLQVHPLAIVSLCAEVVTPVLGFDLEQYIDCNEVTYVNDFRSDGMR